MKSFFVEAKYNEEIELPQIVIDKLPKSVALFMSVQFLGSLECIKKQIEESGREVKLIKPEHCAYEGQLLGCSVDKFDAEAFLYIGDGQFHPKALVLKNNKPVFAYNPISKKENIVNVEDIEKIRKRTMGGISKFLTSDNIGVLTSSKKGQYRIKDIKLLMEKYKDKKIYVFLFDTLDFNSLEDFNFIDVWVNAACPRIIDDYDKFQKALVNIGDLLNLE
ncbi:MAG: diphthamide synthesis protein [Nanoarchaeota archaeon]|nr:diphthamide synthesis protein [Nanoarchaeota archaeon]